MSSEDYADGVQGAGSKWQAGANSDEAESSYEGGATSEAADEYQTNASAAGSSYAAGVAEYIGADPDDITTSTEYTNGVQDAGQAWQDGVSGSGAKWRSGIQQTSASEYEQRAQESAEEWYEGYVEGVSEQ